MKDFDLAAATVPELVEEFAASALRKYDLAEEAEHENEEDAERVSQEIRYGWTIRDELARRGVEARLQLLSLYDHRNVQVRLNAAMATLAVAPVEARRMIEDIANDQLFPQSGAAGMSLWALDTGVFQPT